MSHGFGDEVAAEGLGLGTLPSPPPSSHSPWWDVPGLSGEADAVGDGHGGDSTTSCVLDSSAADGKRGPPRPSSWPTPPRRASICFSEGLLFLRPGRMHMAVRTLLALFPGRSDLNGVGPIHHWTRRSSSSSFVLPPLCLTVSLSLEPLTDGTSRPGHCLYTYDPTLYAMWSTSSRGFFFCGPATPAGMRNPALTLRGSAGIMAPS